MAKSSAASQFFAIATQRSLLTDDAARDLAAECAARNLEPGQLVQEKGLLDAVQVDIIHTLSQPDDTVPGYEILDVLGRGGMGVVFRARQKTLDRIVALKTVLVSQVGHPSALARFEQEARTVARLTHPNIVGAYDFGKHGMRFFLAMEYVQGEDLEQFIEHHRRVAESTSWGLARQAAAALAHAARSGVVHRDVKPANLLLVDPPDGFPLPPGMPMVKVSDFGLALLTTEAQKHTRLTLGNTTLGSPQYMAPEQFSGSDVDARADIFALGATVFQMLTGKPPFAGETLPQLIAHKVSGDLPDVRQFAAQVSEETVQLLAAMMAGDPAARIADYEQLLRRIDALPASQQLSAKIVHRSSGEMSIAPTGVVASDVTQTLDSLPAALSPPSKRLRARLAAIAGLSLALIVAVTMFALLGGNRVPQEPYLVSSGWTRPLYDGRTLSAWTTLPGGLWTPGQDSEGGFILEGRGPVARRLPAPGPQGMPNYRLSIGVQLHEATAVELQFALVPTPSGDFPRYVLRATAQQTVFGHREGENAPLEEIASGPGIGETDAAALGPRYRELRVERHETGWFAFVDGKPIGVATVPRSRELPEFRLIAEGGSAMFESPFVTELIPSAADGEQ